MKQKTGVLAGIEYEMIDEDTIKWNGKYYREDIGEITEEEARRPRVGTDIHEEL